MDPLSRYLAQAESLFATFEGRTLPDLLADSRALAEQAHGARVSYSRKVFIPLTRLCRDVCSYCTFVKSPRQVEAPYLTLDQVVAIAKAGKEAGCREALFTLGDKPELRYVAAKDALVAMGFASTVDYLIEACRRVIAETGLLPHVNAGIMTESEIARLRGVSVSQGIMLESISPRLCEKGGAHFGSPDKHPRVRMAMMEAAGRLRVPFTSGILIGIGESRIERIASLLALQDLHARHGHIQEVIIQNFRAKPDTRMASHADPEFDDLLWTAAIARLILGPEMNIQVPPNLSYEAYPRLLEAGINDWGGVSPVTPDHVNPEAPWPALADLEQRTAAAGRVLVERLAIYPAFARDPKQWVDPSLRTSLLRAMDSEGYARVERWSPGNPDITPPKIVPAGPSARVTDRVATALARMSQGEMPRSSDLVTLFGARGADFDAVCRAADDLRREMNGDVVSYVVNRNINYTNVCTYHCGFCAFSKGHGKADLRGKPYDIEIGEIVRRVHEAWDRGATEVCMQGGIHPDYTGRTYLALVEAVKDAVPEMHVHAFSPLEITHGARTLGLSLFEYLRRLKDAGLGTLPGTAAEILDDEIRAVICPDKLITAEWLDVLRNAHAVGLRTTSTIMFGHVEGAEHWARHLLALRALQAETGGITEFVPLPFVHMEAPLYHQGRTRLGPTFREVVLMHAVARLALHPLITNIQVSWTKLGEIGAAACLNAGANDLGGTLMNESISRAAGSRHGQEMPPDQMEGLIRGLGRTPFHRTTLYEAAPAARRAFAFDAEPLAPLVMSPAGKHARIGGAHAAATT
jgi:FO synthase